MFKIIIMILTIMFNDWNKDIQIRDQWSIFSDINVMIGVDF